MTETLVLLSEQQRLMVILIAWKPDELIWNDGALTGEQQNSFKINMVGAGDTTALAINTNRRIGFGTDTPEHPLHIYRNDAILACFERQGIANAGIEFKKSNSGDGAHKYVPRTF